MSNESAFHDGYKKAMEEMVGLVQEHDSADRKHLLEEIERRIERARCMSRASLAAQSGGDRGY